MKYQHNTRAHKYIRNVRSRIVRFSALIWH